jgi:hypothetical protein
LKARKARRAGASFQARPSSYHSSGYSNDVAMSWMWTDDARPQARQDLQEQQRHVAAQLQDVRRIDEQDVVGLERREQLDGQFWTIVSWMVSRLRRRAAPSGGGRLGVDADDPGGSAR